MSEGKFAIPAVPASDQLGSLETHTEKKVVYTYNNSGAFPVISFVSQAGAPVQIEFVPATEAAPASYTLTLDGVPFSTGDKHCPGKVKTAVRRAVNAVLNVLGKSDRSVKRAEAKTAAVEARAAAKLALAKL